MLNEKSGGQTFGQPSFQAFLHQINPHVFPLLREHRDWKELKALTEGTQERHTNMVTAVQGLSYIVKPHSQRGLNT